METVMISVPSVPFLPKTDEEIFLAKLGIVDIGIVGYAIIGNIGLAG